MFWKLKKTKVLRCMSRSRPGLIRTSSGLKDQATEMAVAGLFQRSDLWRYILIHGRYAQDSQEVKTNKSNKPTSKQATHQRRGALWS